VSTLVLAESSRSRAFWRLSRTCTRLPRRPKPRHGREMRALANNLSIVPSQSVCGATPREPLAAPKRSTR
jgi:hypothetical protein